MASSSSIDNVDSPLSVEQSPLNNNNNNNNLHEQYRKLFIGGLSYSTTDETLR
jgi:RNA recognition motif-containing protein